MKNAFKSALWTLLWSTLSTAGLAIIGWLNDAAEWAADVADGGDQLVQFPDFAVLTGTLMGAAFGIAAGVIVFFVRWGQNRGSIPGESPAFSKSIKE